MNNQIWNNENVYKALFFATEKHKYQLMKYPESVPYSAHFTGVMLTALKYALLMNEKIDFELLCSVALLHDTIEDCDVSYETIKDKFGESIANGVLALSKSKDQSIDKEKRMKDSIKRIKKQPKEIALVKLADRLFNVRCTVPTWSKEKSLQYKAEAQMICDELGYACEPLRKDLQEYINKYARVFEEESYGNNF